MKISIYPPLSIHEIGQRANQEDTIAQWDNRLFVLCDGMGGHERGEVASQTICQALIKWFSENITDDTFTDKLLSEALEYAYTKLDNYDDDNPRKMGTTLTLLYIHAQGITVAHIGDSRIYHLRPNVGILYQSRDHSLAFDLFEAGEISYEEIATFPKKNIITRALQPGHENRVRPDIIHITDIHPNDWLYTCTDGMLETITNDQLSALLSSNDSDEIKREMLAKGTEDNQDNHSAWLIHINEVAHEKGDELLVNEEPTTRYNALNIIPRIATDSEEKNVVVVLSPSIPPNERTKWIKICVLLLIVIGALTFFWKFFFHNERASELKRPEPMMQHPTKT